MRQPFILFSLLLVGSCDLQGDPAITQKAPKHSSTSEQELLSLEWNELLPEGEDERLVQMYEDFYADLNERRFGGPQTMLNEAQPIEEGSPLDEMPQLGTFATVDELHGKRVEIPGFAVPLDMTGGEVSTFLIVPYFGACIHTPPPPPNQIVYTRAEPTVKINDLYAPYWFEGTLETESADTDLGNAAYTLRLVALRDYE